MHTCRLSEPGFTKCSTISVQKVIDQMNIGIPEIVEKYGTLDPMHPEDIVFKQDSNEVATISANLSQIELQGFLNVKIKESR